MVGHLLSLPQSVLVEDQVLQLVIMACLPSYPPYPPVRTTPTTLLLSTTHSKT